MRSGWAGWPAVIGGLVGARLLFVAENPAAFAANPVGILALYEGGISVFGAVLGGIAGAVLHALTARLAVARLLGAIAPGFLVGRIGDLTNGEHWGTPAAAPWSVTYVHPQTLGRGGVAVHPAVGYEALRDLAAAGAGAFLLRRGVPAGAAFWLSQFLYGLGRRRTGFYRLDARYALGLGLAQWLGVVAAAVAGAALLRLGTRRQALSLR